MFGELIVEKEGRVGRGVVENERRMKRVLLVGECIISKEYRLLNVKKIIVLR